MSLRLLNHLLNLFLCLTFPVQIIPRSKYTIYIYLLCMRITDPKVMQHDCFILSSFNFSSLIERQWHKDLYSLRFTLFDLYTSWNDNTMFNEHPSSLIYIKLKKQIIFVMRTQHFLLNNSLMYVVYLCFFYFIVKKWICIDTLTTKSLRTG